MSPETEKNVNEAIDWLQKTGGSIQDFATEQAPLYCQEIVAWTFWSNLVGCIVGFIGIIVACLIGKKLLQWCSSKEQEPDGIEYIAPPLFAIALISFIAGFIGIACTLPEVIKAKTAPRLVIVEHLRDMAK